MYLFFLFLNFSNLNLIRSICSLHGDPIDRYVLMIDNAVIGSWIDNSKGRLFEDLTLIRKAYFKILCTNYYIRLK